MAASRASRVERKKGRGPQFQNNLKLKGHEPVLCRGVNTGDDSMFAKLIAAAAIGAVLSTAAFAQNADQNASAKGQLQASKLIHMNVYNGQNEKIGDIKELLLDKSGK